MADAKNEVVVPTKKLKKPVEQIRAELLADPEVKEQARLLKLDVEAYVEKIIDYAVNPDKPPQLVITPDEELKKLNPKLPTEEDVGNYIQKIIDGEVTISRAQQRDGFNKEDADARYRTKLASDAVPMGAPEARKNPAPIPGAVDPDNDKKTPKS